MPGSVQTLAGGLLPQRISHELDGHQRRYGSDDVSGGLSVTPLRVLVGCEESGVVRDAFIARGHDALSCDLEPTRRAGPHYQGDLFDVIDYPWDLAIFHPPCTHTSVSGAKHFAAKWYDGRQAAGVSFIMKVKRRAAHISRFAIEQPVSIIKFPLKRPDDPENRPGIFDRQVIQPWMFGHPETKATVLWLHNLPRLVPTQIVDGREARVHRMPPSETRARDRSTTYLGIAQAFADQWGSLATPPSGQLDVRASDKGTHLDVGAQCR